MLKIYRRHLKSCIHRSKGRDYRDCKCPVWVDGLIGRRDIRQSLKTGNWQRANEQVHEWEARGTVVEEKPDEPITVAGAAARFLKDGRARGLRRPTLYKYRFLFRRLRDFARNRGIRYIAEMDLDNTRRFRESWTDRNLSALKKLERLRAFFRFCTDSSWIGENPAKKIKNPKITQSPTLPFSRDQVASILGSVLI